MSFPMGQLIQAANIMNMNLPEGIQNITLQAISEALLTSWKALYNLTAVHTKPMKRGIVVKTRMIFFFYIISSVAAQNDNVACLLE